MTRNFRLTVDLKGVLQGVGFRPAVARLVSDYNLDGWIRNQSAFVRLSICGPLDKIESFIAVLPKKLPPKGVFTSMERIALDEVTDWEKGFVIKESLSTLENRISIPEDLVMCDKCRTDIFDKNSRYYGYPFTSCTDCGPRYTVVKGMPYDRVTTTMQKFKMCPDCESEYSDFNDRRFHAQTIACPACGPSLSLFDNKKNRINCNPLKEARASIKNGKIVAVKGLGGFLLACDPFNEEAVKRLRLKKKRPHKPFAVMANGVEILKKYCLVSEIEEHTLTSSAGPIVILDFKTSEDVSRLVPKEFELIAPNTGTLGAMLPTTPLHQLLAMRLDGDDTPDFEFLIMTSGNRGGEPICTDNEDAFDTLVEIADLFLIHDRDIHFRNDDSIVMKCSENISIIRSGRGYSPSYLKLKNKISENVLAFGADLKNSISIGFNDEIITSPHIGDLENPVAIKGAEQIIKEFPRYLKFDAGAVVVDLHPDMHSSRLGRKYAEVLNIPVYEVQHHYAHGASVMAEYGLNESIALCFDGTGLGTDGTIWGAELMHINKQGFKRLGTFRPVHLPGGDAAVKEPVRQLIARFAQSDEKVDDSWLDRLNITKREFDAWTIQCKRGLNAPLTHAAGRLFDAFSALLGIAPKSITYEGQGAIWLEAAASQSKKSKDLAFETFVIDDFINVDFSGIFSSFAVAPPLKNDIPMLAMGFHKAIINAGFKMALFGRENTGCSTVVLSGGVMMNRIITNGLAELLKNNGFEVFLPQIVPVNDAGISIGQIYAFGGNR
ncbi:MAG: carbamoyltransferase HypF [Deltaproteobacteria bacterium]|nr:carbamoyltransferase HypF [Deltaproteobacteria bacterium]